MEISEMKRRIMEQLKDEKPNLPEGRKEGSIDRLTRMIKTKDKKAEEPRIAYEASAKPSSDELSLKIEALEREKKNLESKLSQLKMEIDAKNKRVEEAERLYKESNETVKNIILRFEPIELEKRKLESKLSQLRREFGTAEKRRESDKALAEETVRKIRSELDAMKSKFEARDEGIEKNIESYTKILKEVSELNQRAKATLAREKEPR